jgi:hypothetical protein
MRIAAIGPMLALAIGCTSVEDATVLENSTGKADGTAAAKAKVTEGRPEARFELVCSESWAFDKCNITVVAQPSADLYKFTEQLLWRHFGYVGERRAGETLWKYLATLTVAQNDGESYYDDRWPVDIRMGLRSNGDGTAHLVTETTNVLTSPHRGIYTVFVRWQYGVQGLPDAREFSVSAAWE